MDIDLEQNEWKSPVIPLGDENRLLPPNVKYNMVDFLRKQVVCSRASLKKPSGLT